MAKSLSLLVLVWILLGLAAWAETAETDKEPGEVKEPGKAPLIGKYPMSGFVRVRTAKTVGKNHLSFSLKMQYCDYDEFRDIEGCYCDLAGEDCNRKFTTVLCTKFGWAKDHHLALGIPYLWNDMDFKGTTVRNDGFGNIFVFEKWNLIKESSVVPGIALDVWYYFPTGDTRRKLGRDDYAWKPTMEISKAWKDFSVHVNPGYRFSEGRDCDVIEGNAMVLFTASKKFWPAVEYNYTYKEGAGRCNDIIPGFVWKFAAGASFKLGAVINADSTMKFKDEVGVVAKLFYRF